jgi:hypothetical protein
MSTPMTECREAAVIKRGDIAAACGLHQFELTTADSREDFPAGTRAAGPLDICGQHLRQPVPVGDVLARLDEVVDELWKASPRRGANVSPAFRTAADDLADLAELAQRIARPESADRVATVREFRRGAAVGRSEAHLTPPPTPHRRPGLLARLLHRRGDLPQT